MVKVSLIIPVYNVESFLEECLNSVEKQTYGDFECILVDDGSTDQSGKMCDKYAETHENTRVIHKENGGLSDARNVGVEACDGEFVVFMDSDDYVTEDYLEYLVSLTEKYKTDIAIAGVKKFEDGTVPEIIPKEETEKVLSKEKVLEKICYGEYGIYAPSKIYRRELVLENKYPAGKFYEDLATTYRIVGACQGENIAFGSREIYYWRQRTGSITKSKINEDHLYGITAGKGLVEYMEKNYPSVVPAAKVRAANKIIDLAYRLVMGKNDKVLFRALKKEIKPLKGDILKNPKASLSVKARAVTLNMGYIPFKLLSIAYSLVK